MISVPRSELSAKTQCRKQKHDSLVEENRKLNDLISKRDDIQNELSKAKQELTAVKSSVKSANDELAKANDSLAEVKSRMTVQLPLITIIRKIKTAESSK